MELVENWTSYSASALWQLSDQYYLQEGIDAWASSQKKPIPHRSTSNFQSAKSIAKLVKKYIEITGKSVTVLELGAGHGRFSRNFLLACKRLKIIDQVKLIISDYSLKNLEDIAARKILRNFDNKNYELIHLDITNLENAKDLNGNQYTIRSLDCIIQLSVFEALPLTILRQRNGSFEEQEIKIQKLNEFKYLNIEAHSQNDRLLKDYRWQAYQIDQKSDLEQKYFKKFTDYYKNTDFEYIPYPFHALNALENLINCLNPEGFMFSTNLKFSHGEPWYFIGDVLSHEVDSDFLLNCYDGHKYLIDQNVMQRYIISKDHETINHLEPLMKEIYEKNNSIKRYLALYSILKDYSVKEFADCYKFLLKEFTKLNYKSTQVYMFWAGYYKMIGDVINSNKCLRKAEEFDFWNESNQCYN